LIKHDISAFNSLKECCTFSYLLFSSHQRPP
jgi:hypothetical protein